MTRHLAIVGPTASGKSAIALAVAQARADVEIVSLDSMQVYRGMDIGTAKPSAAERSAVAHHLIDVADVGETWSVARAQHAARRAVADIEARGGRALLVGGTGLYVQAVIDDITIPAEDLDVRERLRAECDTPDGLAAAWARLVALDPQAASRIEANNQRRIVRALEVIEITGRPFSAFGPGLFAVSRAAFDVSMIGIWTDRATLATRIQHRVDAMRECGLVDEVRGLAGRLSAAAAQAIGYKELLEVFAQHPDGIATNPDEADIDAAFEAIVRRTRQFARRQRMWFRRDPRVQWLRPDPGNVVGASRALLACWRPS